MVRIHVTGDVVRNTNLIRLSPNAAGETPALPETVVRVARGGAAALRDLVAVACADLNPTLTGGEPPDGPLPETLTIWAQFPHAPGDRAPVWRVEQFLRTHRLDGPPAMSEAGDTEPLPEGPLELLVIDDANLGYRDDATRWRRLLTETRPDQVILKTRYPLPPEPLWRELLARRERLTVIVPISALRARHAPITRGLSWDRTMEDVYRELTQGASAQDLGQAHRVMIPFGHAGVAVFTRRHGDVLDLERAIYHPERLEGEDDRRGHGWMLGGASRLTAALARHLARPEDYPLFVAAARGLAAMVDLYDRGAGPATGSSPDDVLVPFASDPGAQRRLRDLLHPDQDIDPKPEAVYRAAFHRSEPKHDGEGARFSCSLLREATDPGRGISWRPRFRSSPSG